MTTTNEARHGMYRITYANGTESHSLVEATSPNEAVAVARAETTAFAPYFAGDVLDGSRPVAATFVRTVEAEAARVAAAGTVQALADDTTLRAAHLALAPAHMASLLAEDVDDADVGEANRRVREEMAATVEGAAYVVRSCGDNYEIAGSDSLRTAKTIATALAGEYSYGTEVVRTSDGAVDSGDGFDD